MKQNRTTIVKQYKVFALPTATRIEQSRKNPWGKEDKVFDAAKVCANN